MGSKRAATTAGRGKSRNARGILGTESVISISIFAVVGVFLVSIGTFVWYDITFKSELKKQSVIQNIRSVSGILAETTQAMLAANEVSVVRRVVMEMSVQHNLDSCRVILPSGEVLADSRPTNINIMDLPESWAGDMGTYDERADGNFFAVRSPLHVPGRGEASLEITARVDKLPLSYSEPLPVNMAIAGVALAAILLVHRHSRFSLKAITAIRETLLEDRKGEVDISSLQIDPELGEEAVAWNQLLKEQEEQEILSTLEKIREALPNESGNCASLGAVCDALPHGIILLGQNMQVEYANGAAAVLLKTQRSELKGSEISNFIVDEQLNNMMRATVNGSATRRAMMELSRDGSKTLGVLRFTVCPVDHTSQARAAVVVEDISQQKVAEEARNSFLAHATHELRTPLTNIRLYVEDALEKCETDAAATASSLDVINKECKRLERTVSEILSVCQIEAGSLDLKRDDVNMDCMLKDLQADFEAHVREKQIKLMFDIPVKMPILQADRDQISLALHNLLGNAVKYTPKGGEVSVKTTVDEEKIEIEIRDTGIGIGPDDIDRIFDRFYRAQDTRLGAIEGSGLGLPIAREVVRLHGGEINVESELNNGSTFRLVLPMSEELVPSGY